MAKKDINVAVLIGYLLIWWGGVAALFVMITSNGAPGAPQLAFSEEEIFTTTKLEVDIATEAPDPNGDKIDYEYSWTLDGEAMPEKKSNTISSKETMKGQTWEVTVVPDDGSRDGWGCSLPWRECAGAASATLAVTVGNTPPRARGGFVNQEGGIIESYDRKTDLVLDLSCFDPDILDAKRNAEPEEAPPEPAEGEEPVEPEDPCTYTIAWYPGSVEDVEATEPTSTEPMLSASDARGEDSWKVLVVANDGESDGEALELTIAKEE